jgi:HK97 family phage prohead protease
MPSQASKRKLTDVRETRHSPRKIELRDDSRTGDLILEGYASTFDEYEVYGGPENYGWIEVIDRKAFGETLRQSPDLHLLINHDGMPLARTKSGTLTLSVDDVGLRVEARLDRTDPDVQALIPKMARGDMDEMSFAFRVKQQQWRAAEGFEDDPMSFRTITELSLQRGDVSIVNFGANPNTSANLALVGSALGVLADADESELRSGQIDKRTLTAAADLLAKLTRKKKDDEDDDNEDEDGDEDQDENDGDDDDEEDGARKKRNARNARQFYRAIVDDDALSELDDTLGEAADQIQEFDRGAFDPEALRVFDLTTHAGELVSDMLGQYGMGDDDDGSEAVGAKQRGPRAISRQRRNQGAKRRKPVATRQRRSTIADGLRIEVSGTQDKPVVRLHDASGLLDEGLRTRLASELREAVIGNRGAVSSARPSTKQGDTISKREAAQLTGGDTEKLSALKASIGQDPRPTVSLADARKMAEV